MLLSFENSKTFLLPDKDRRYSVGCMIKVLSEKGINCKVRYVLDFEVTPHQLRHTYITNLIASGVAPKTVQYLAGHENSKITMDIYAKAKYNKPEEIAGAMGKAFAMWDEQLPT